MAEPKSLLDRIGDALKSDEAQKKEAVSQPAAAARTLPDRIEEQARRVEAQTPAHVEAAKQAVAKPAENLAEQLSDLRSRLTDKERELNRKAGELATQERMLASKEAALVEKSAALAEKEQQIAALQAALKQAQEESATLREQARAAGARSVASPAVPARTYTVKAGDSLSAIAKAVYGNANRWGEIFAANQDKIKDPKLIRPGQVLHIP